MKWLRSFLLGFCFILAASFPASAQYQAVASCPGAVALQPVGSGGAVALVDVNGNLCISGNISTTPSGTQPISAVALPLPSGAATAANQNTGIGNITVALSGMTSNNAATQIALQGTNSAAVLLSGTWVGTLTPYVSADGGTTWAATVFINPATQAISGTVTGNGTYSILGTGGMTHARVVLSPYTSGTVTGNLSATSQGPSDASVLYGLSLQTGTAGSPASQVVSVQGVVSGTPVPTQGPSTGGGFPTSATAITISSTGTTGAVAAALAAAASKTTYICGFSITSDAVAGLSGNATVAGIITGTMTYIQGVGVAPAVASTTQTFNPCVPSSTTNTAITVTSAAAGTGGTTAVNAWGYQQ